MCSLSLNCCRQCIISYSLVLTRCVPPCIKVVTRSVFSYIQVLTRLFSFAVKLQQNVFSQTVQFQQYVFSFAVISNKMCSLSLNCCRQCIISYSLVLTRCVPPYISSDKIYSLLKSISTKICSLLHYRSKQMHSLQQ